MSNKKLIIFNGSPRKKGTSYSFARTFKQLAEEQGNSAEIIHIIEYLDEGKKIEDLRKVIADSDTIALSSPLYVDSLPYPVIWFFERLAEEAKHELQGKKFFAIGQCAFPYPALINTLLQCCRCFSESVDMKWMGGLAYGGGVLLNGELLENLGKKGQKITDAFGLALKDIFEDKTINPVVQDKLSMKFPKIMARPMAMFLNHSIKSSISKKGLTVEDIERKFYAD